MRDCAQAERKSPQSLHASREMEGYYKQEIEELRQAYCQLQLKLKKEYLEKEQKLKNKCQKLEEELEAVKKTLHRNKQEQIEETKNPFFLEDIESILIAPVPDESYESIMFNIKQFMSLSSFQEITTKLEKNLKGLIGSARQDLLKEPRRVPDKIENSKHPKQGVQMGRKEYNYFIQAIETEVQSCFTFISQLLKRASHDSQRFQQISKAFAEAQDRYEKIKSANEILQRDNNFITNHIRRLSQENLVFKKKNQDLQKNSRTMQYSIKEIKPTYQQKQQPGPRNLSKGKGFENQDRELLMSSKELYNRERRNENVAVFPLRLRKKNQENIEMKKAGM